MRRFLDKIFSLTAGGSILLMLAALLIILGPMILRGARAVFFDATVEWRKMHFYEDYWRRGDPKQIKDEQQRTNKARSELYKIMDRFAIGIDVEPNMERVKNVYRQLKDQLKNWQEQGRISRDERFEIRGEAWVLRKKLTAAFQTTQNQKALEYLNEVLDYPRKDIFKGTEGQRFFELAGRYASVARNFNFDKRDQYAESFEQVRKLIYKLLGPKPDTKPESILIKSRYGATRWDRAQEILDDILYKTTWVTPEGGDESSRRVMKRIARVTDFRGTEMEKVFSILENDLDDMLNPRFTFYWRYFFDDSVPSHLYGGIWPDIFGTLLITALSLLFAFPVGLIAAAYLVECAGENIFVRIVRTCINTLAGVPSIVFGLFGMAFFLGFLPKFKWLRLSPESNVLAGAMTMSLLILPIIIRASEEAIRTVPRHYKEASLALGASKFHTFMTVTLPSSLPGVLTGAILSMSRAAGETAPLLGVAAVFAKRGMVESLFKGPTRVLSYSSYAILYNPDAKNAPHQQYGVVMTLILIVIILNVTAIILRWRASGKLRGR